MNVITLEDRRDLLEYRDGSGGTVEIFNIQVLSDRRKGRGRRLVNTLLDLHLSPDVKLVWAITRADNFIAQEFYEAMGFRVVAPLRNFYQDTPANSVDAVMYGRDIKA